ncbi:cupredoxin domain-containing protein [Microcoleus sp. B5-D4]|uniref:cupredoxin domain-containing protein n=1 Tax=unclassified Microcoleus TaxID=2642155 RepID=UPI002FD4E81F
MIGRTRIIGTIASLGVVVGMLSGEGIAQNTHETHPTQTQQKSQFQRIEQPLSNKILVTLAGIGLISLELWWFLLSKPKSQKAVTASGGIQEVTITVDGGYEPSRLVVQAGQPVRLNFHRQDPSSCLEQVLIPDFHIAADLHLNQVTSVEFTPKKAGSYVFSCGMNMFRGEIIAEDQQLESTGLNEPQTLTESQFNSSLSTHPHETKIEPEAMQINPPVDQGIQKVTIVVNKGYTPNHLVVKAGKPVQLHFLRETSSGCLARVLIPDFNIATDLSLNQVTTIELTPEEVGEHTFSCGMNMFRGIIEVQAANVSDPDDMAAQALNN